jgi:phosphoribosylanthranilate isomerase
VVRVKICGLTRAEDVAGAVAAGADAVGLVFHPSSPRYVTPEQAAGLAALLPPFVAAVGLFVNVPVAVILRTHALCRLDYVQLHGHESAAFCHELRSHYSGRIIKAVRVGGRADLEGLTGYPVDAWLLDAQVTGAFGGTGTAFDWALLQGAFLPHPWILAGGLSPDNVARAIAATHPAAVDVSSGVECAPGVKDGERMRQFVCQARGGQPLCQ